MLEQLPEMCETDSIFEFQAKSAHTRNTQVFILCFPVAFMTAISVCTLREAKTSVLEIQPHSS